MNFADVKAITIPEGAVKKITAAGKVIWKKVVVPTYTNILPLAVDASGNPYNGGLGYKTGYRLNSSKAEVAHASYCCTGFIPITGDGIIRIKGVTKSTPGGGYLYFFKADRTTGVGSIYESALYNTAVNGVLTFKPEDLSAQASTAAYMRISTGVIDGNTIITLNEEIT